MQIEVIALLVAALLVAEPPVVRPFVAAVVLPTVGVASHAVAPA